MSAFIVNKETIDKAVSIVAPFVLGCDANEFRPVEQYDEIGRQLWQLNAEAVAQRYAEEPQGESAYKYRKPGCSLVVALKGLRCLVYQCSEGDVPDRILYKQMAEAADRAAMEVVRSLPEYDTADWG